MRSSIAAATFAALVTGTMGVSALDLTGSDTLKQISIDVLSACGANCTGLVYIGTGSSAGQANLINNVQDVAPMSRFLNNGICSSASRTSAEGVVLALDGVNVIGNEARACNADGQGIEVGPSAGDWRNALRTIYAGLPTAAGNNIQARSCNSGERRTLVNTWNDLFEGDCSGKDCNADTHPTYDGGTAATRYDRFNNVVEPGLRHAFRRDEESGTTDVFLGLLSLPTMNFVQAPLAGTHPAGTSAATITNQTNAFKSLSNSIFCNVRRPTDTYPPVTVPSWSHDPATGLPLSETDATASIIAGSRKVIPETVNMGNIPVPAAPAAPYTGWDHDNNPGTLPQWHILVHDVYFPEFQDQDPVRRKCAGTNSSSSPTLGAEQVCSADAHLGVVLPINPPPVAASIAYPTAVCNGFAQVNKALKRPNGIGVLCPDGSLPLGAPAECLMPIVQATGSCECMTRGGAWGDNTASGQIPGYAPLGGPPGSVIDGRVYNLQLRDAACDLRTINRPNPAGLTQPPLPVFLAGSFYRIHTTKTLLAAPAATSFNCQKTDATRQLGCLVQASPCSIAFAGGQAVDDNPDLTPANGVADATVGIRVNNVLPGVTEIRNLVTGGGTVYPFARKLYVNTLDGFHNAPANEQELVKAYTTGVQAGGSSIPEDFGFVSLPGAPFCEDFNELALCTAAQTGCTVSGTTTTCPANVNACNASNVAGIPSGTAHCGDGVVQAGEACDDGNSVTDTAAGGDVCSVSCTTTL